MDLQDVFIQNLRYFRKQNRLTQNELTLQIDMGLNYINGVEQRKYFPQPYVIERIAQVLKIQPYQLFLEDGCPKNFISFNKNEYIEKITDKLHKLLKEDIKKELQLVLK